MLHLSLLLLSAVPLPEGFVFPPSVTVAEASLERWSEVKIELEPEAVLKQGRHLELALTTTAGNDEDRSTYWKPIRASLAAAGWTVVKEWLDTQPGYATVKRSKGGKEWWATFAMFNREDIRVHAVEPGPNPTKLSFKPPAARVETVSDTQVWPWFALPAQATLASSSPDTGDFFVSLDDAEEPTLVGEHVPAKYFVGLEGMSNLEFAAVYADAFQSAGWAAVTRIPEHIEGTDVLMVFHYTKNGRNIWARLHYNQPEMQVMVADSSADDFAASLEKECRLTLSGVTFDFNQATLRPDSTPTLEKAAAVLVAHPTYTVEVQGHTDDVGGDASNQTLSERRAKTVKDWLVAHKVGAAKLSSKGYGKSQPVTTNETPEGRARNRRVELRRGDCKK
jgi:outer membrane protein OmpA-like peptidoglycan-associated protein